MKTDKLTKQELCEALELSISSIGNYQQMGMPVLERGKMGKPSLYNLDDCLAWINANIKSGGEDMSAAKLRKLQAEASLAELELQRERGELVEIEEVAKQVADAFSRVRSKLLTIPTKTSGLVYALQSQREVQTVLDEAIREVLLELSTEFNN